MIKYLTHESSNIVYVGDMHGHYSEFMRQLDRLQFDDKKDIVISSGDLIDRGDENLNCLRLVQQPWFHCVVANHELLAIHSSMNGYDGVTHAKWISNGGGWFEKLTSPQKQEVDDLLKLLVLGSRPCIELYVADAIQKVGVVHAGIPKGMSWSDMGSSSVSNDHLHRFVATRVTQMDEVSAVFETSPNELDLIVVGHNVLSKSSIHAHGKMVFMDTGAGKNGTLCLSRHNELIDLISSHTLQFDLKM
jgi:serine/threonine protein phosphatase 1